MKKPVIIGTDVSKSTLDYGISTCHAHLKTNNNSKGFAQWLLWALQYGRKEELWVIMGPTGYYSYQFELFLHHQQIRYSKVAALEIKRSVGLVRGKSDKIDAFTISRYGWMRRDELQSQPLSAAVITELKDLTGDIKEVEAAIKELLKQDAVLENNYRLLVSIKGVGFVTAVYMIAYTENFSKFTNSRKFSCYAGLAPFEHSSGSSIKGRERVSHYANKKAKQLLNLAASVAIQHNKELKAYYQRRVSAGKSKMGILNII